MQRCSHCKTIKPLDDFPRSRNEKSGHGSWCKRCNNEYYHAKRKERLALGRCQHHNAPLTSASRCARCEETYRSHNLKIYGITVAQYEAMLAAQGGVCAICHMTPSDRGRYRGEIRVRRLNVDHDHVTGRVRGLLCTPCNSSLGHAQDKPERLMAMAEYLEPEPRLIGACG